jgi:hypothetical protein
MMPDRDSKSGESAGIGEVLAEITGLAAQLQGIFSGKLPLHPWVRLSSLVVN